MYTYICIYTYIVFVVYGIVQLHDSAGTAGARPASLLAGTESSGNH